MGYRTTKSKIEVESNKTDNYTDFYYHFFRNILLVSIPLVIISVVILSSLHISATDSTSSTDTLSFNISSSCTLSSVVDSSHTAELINGTYVSGIGQTTITTLCNDGNGYSVYANGYSNNEEGNNKLVNTENSNFNIVSGTAQSGTTSNWAMSLNHLVDDPSFTPPVITSGYDGIYGIVPNEWTKVASLPARATDMIKGSSFTTTYAVYTSSSQYAGTYNGQVKYMLVHPNNNKPTLTNLEVAFASHGIQPAYQDETGSYFAMQDMSTEICNSVSGDGETTATQLVDTRDNKLYYVTKLADGHCWMTQNLDFDIDATRTYTHNDTDLGWDPNNFDTNATWTPDTTNGKYNLPVNGTSVPGWSNQNNYPYSADPGDVYYYTSNSEANDIKYNSLSECIAANHTEGDCKHYHAGNYYNWTAAIASNNSSNLTTQYTNAPNSICPKGWRLPIATNASQSVYEFGELLYQQGITKTKTSASYTENGFNDIRKAPLYLTRGGFINSSSIRNSGSYGFLHARTTYNNSDSYGLIYVKTVISMYNSWDFSKSYGRFIRCLAQ